MKIRSVDLRFDLRDENSAGDLISISEIERLARESKKTINTSSEKAGSAGDSDCRSCRRNAILALSLQGIAEKQEDIIKDLSTRYNELLYGVAKVHPGESRHETALRYIQQAEMPQNNPPQTNKSVNQESQ